MASYNPGVKNAAFRMYIVLYDSDGAIVTNPTLAAGDAIVSTNGGATSNLDTLPSVVPAAGDFVQLDLSADEMNGDNVAVRFEDQAGAEWASVALSLHPVAAGQQFDDLSTLGGTAQTGDGYAIVNSGTYGNAQLVRSTTPANTLTVDASNRALANLGAILGTALTETGGYLSAGFKKLFNVASPVLTAESVNQTGDSYARLAAPAGVSVSADIAAVKVDTAATLADTGTDGVVLANDAITSAKFDESTAFPVKATDSGATYIARTGADGDTLEDLSDEIAAVKVDTAAILLDTGTDGVTVQELKVSALADMFNTDSGTDYASSAAGSVVKEIADNAGGSALTPASIWAYTARTLTQSAASVASAVAGSTITATRGDTLVATLTGLGSIADRTKLWVAVKWSPDKDTDAQAVLLIEQTAGLTVVNGVAYTTIADGSITVNDASTGSITITVKPAVTDDLAEAISEMAYDVQKLNATGVVVTLRSGTFNVVTSSDVTRAIS